MSGAEAVLRDALTSWLEADAGVQAVLGNPVRINLTPEDERIRPFAAWGRCETRPLDAQDVRLEEVRLTLQLSVRAEDGLEATGALREALGHAAPVLPAPWRLVRIQPVFSDVLRTRSIGLMRGVIRLLALVEHEMEGAN